MKLTMITIIYAIGMLVWLIWKFGSKKETKEFMDEVYEIDGLNLLPENLVILLVVGVAIIISCFWPIELIKYPYKRFKKKSKKSS
jgi:hypothetical protein